MHVQTTTGPNHRFHITWYRLWVTRNCSLIKIHLSIRNGQNIVQVEYNNCEQVQGDRIIYWMEIKRPRSQNTKCVAQKQVFTEQTFRTQVLPPRPFWHCPQVQRCCPFLSLTQFPPSLVSSVGQASDMRLADSSTEGCHTSSNGHTAPPKGKSNLCK